jgi:hypothetical protein
MAAVVPGLALGGGIFVDVARAPAGLFSPSFRLSLLAASVHTSFTSPTGANLTWRVVRAEACPLRLGQETLSATVCAAVDAGVLGSEGTGLPNIASDNRAWVVTGALSRVAWGLRDGPWIEAAAGFGVLMERYSFYYYQVGGMPGTTQVGQMPLVGAEFGLGAGYRFR